MKKPLSERADRNVLGEFLADERWRLARDAAFNDTAQLLENDQLAGAKLAGILLFIRVLESYTEPKSSAKKVSWTP